MYNNINRLYRQIHGFLLENHHTIAMIGTLTIFSYLIYHLPAHVLPSKFKRLNGTFFSEVCDHFGVGSQEAISAIIGLIISFAIVFLYLPYILYHDVQDLFDFRQRRKYLDAQFRKLLSDCQKIQKLFANNDTHSLDNLHNINEFLIQCLDKFRADVDRVLTPTLEEMFSDPREFFEVEEDLRSLV